MERRANQTASSIARQLCIGVQRDDVANLGKQIVLSSNHNETGVARATQQPIELSQFAALSFPANPFRFRFAPLTPPVKQMKANCFATAVTPIKFINAVSRS